MRRAVFVVLALVSCSRPFDTRATYDAPKTGFRVIIDSKGVVPSGEDLGAAPATVLICSRVGRELWIDVPPYSTSPRSAVAHDSAATTTMAWGDKTTAASLTRVLISEGYTPDAAEVDETLAVVDGVGFGPKGTHMPKQTHALAVVSVDFHSTHPAAARCTP